MIINATLQIMKVRFREISYLPKVLQLAQWWSQDMNLPLLQISGLNNLVPVSKMLGHLIP